LLRLFETGAVAAKATVRWTVLSALAHAAEPIAAHHAIEWTNYRFAQHAKPIAAACRAIARAGIDALDVGLTNPIPTHGAIGETNSLFGIRAHVITAEAAVGIATDRALVEPALPVPAIAAITFTKSAFTRRAIAVAAATAIARARSG
jgi:hypothetical protein